MLKPEDIKVGTRLAFIDDEAKLGFIGEAIDNKNIVDKLYNNYFKVLEIDEDGDYVLGLDYFIEQCELRYFKIVETPEQLHLSQAMELIKDMLIDNDPTLGGLSDGIRIRANAFLHKLKNN